MSTSAVDHSRYAVLVARLEREADDHPRIHFARVAMVAALGYAPIALCVGALLGACLVIVGALLTGTRVPITAGLAIVAAAVASIVIAQALIVRIEAPEGRTVVREEAPALFALLDDVLQRMAWKRGGRLHKASLASVTLDHEFNANLHQIPARGVFGGYANHLQIGIPLLAVLDAAELKTLLAHEIGHLGTQRTRFEAWIHRQRTTWRALQIKFDAPTNVVDRVLGAFYRWYTPNYLAYTFAMARVHEYAADRAAAEATHARVLARALVKTDLIGRFLNEIFWPRFFAQVEQTPEPSYLPFGMLPRAVSIAHKEWLRNDWLEASLRKFAAEHDTHPSLAERLAALEAPRELPTVTQTKPALGLCGDLGPVLLKWCDDTWREENALPWRKRHEAIKEAHWKIAQYQNTPAGELKSDDLWQKTLLLLDIGNENDALNELRTLVTVDPKAAKAHMLLGRLLLEHGDETGLRNLTEAAHDAELAETAGQLGYDYLMTRGRKGEAQRFWQRIQAA